MLSFLYVQFSHLYMTTGKTIALTKRTFVGKVMSLLFNMPSRLNTAFLPRSKRLLVSWLQSPSAICSDFGAKKNKVCHCFPCFPIYLPWSDRTRCHDLSFLMLSFEPTFSLSSFNLIKRLYFFFAFCHKCGVICISKVIDISPGSLDFSLCFIQSSISHDVLCI